MGNNRYLVARSGLPGQGWGAAPQGWRNEGGTGNGLANSCLPRRAFSLSTARGVGTGRSVRPIYSEHVRHFQ